MCFVIGVSHAFPLSMFSFETSIFICKQTTLWVAHHLFAPLVSSPHEKHSIGFPKGTFIPLQVCHVIYLSEIYSVSHHNIIVSLTSPIIVLLDALRRLQIPFRVSCPTPLPYEGIIHQIVVGRNPGVWARGASNLKHMVTNQGCCTWLASFGSSVVP